MNIPAIITNILISLPYPVDYTQVVGNVQALLSEHSDVPIDSHLVRNAVLTSLDILDNTEYDLDMVLLGELNDEEGFYDYDWIEGSGIRDLRS